MSKTVQIGNSPTQHLRVSEQHKSPLCGATHPIEATGPRHKKTEGPVTCERCKLVATRVMENLLA